MDFGTVDLGLFLGDFNHSASVNQFDLALFIPKLFVLPGSPNYDPKFDLNGDALLNVNQFDLALLIDRLFKPVLSAPLVAEADGVDLLQASVEASQASFTVSSLTPATAPTLISQPGESSITPSVSFSLQAFEVSDEIFYAPLSPYDDASTTGLELESNADQIDLDYRTRRFLGNRAVAKPTAIDLSDSRIDTEDFEEEQIEETNFQEEINETDFEEEELDDVFHSVDWLDSLNDGSLI